MSGELSDTELAQEIEKYRLLIKEMSVLKQKKYNLEKGFETKEVDNEMYNLYKRNKFTIWNIFSNQHRQIVEDFAVELDFIDFK